MATATVQREDLSLSEVQWENTSFCKHFLTSLSSLRERDIHTDVTLKTDGQQFRCHRVVLSAASEYFSAVFAQGFEEVHQDTVEIKGTDSETLQCIIDYIYTAKIQIKASNVQSLTQASAVFQLLDLKDACEKFMLQQIESSNCIGLHNFSKLLNLQSLQRESKHVMLKQFREVVRSHEFLQLDVEDLIQYLMDDGLEVQSEDAVFEAVTLWLKHDPETRKAACDRIMACVRFPYCTRDYLCQVVKVNEFMTSDLCKTLVEEACTFQMFPDRRQEMDSPRTCPRKKSHLVIVGGITSMDFDTGSPSYCWYLKEESSSWEKLNELPDLIRIGLGVCVLPGGVFITGGGKCGSDCWFFHTEEKKWERTPSMKTARTWHGTLLHGGRVYTIGGIDNHNTLRSVEVMDITTRQWSGVPDMLIPSANLATVSCGESIYVFHRDVSEEQCSQTTQMYSSTRREWYMKSNIPCRPEEYTSKCGLITAVTHHGKIYVAVEDTFMQYEPIRDTWAILEPHREMRSVGFGATVVWKGKILLGGGIKVPDYFDEECNGKEFTDIIEQYDVGTDLWTDWTIRLKTKLAGHNLVTMDLSAM